MCAIPFPIVKMIGNSSVPRPTDGQWAFVEPLLPKLLGVWTFAAALGRVAAGDAKATCAIPDRSRSVSAVEPGGRHWLAVGSPSAGAGSAIGRWTTCSHGRKTTAAWSPDTSFTAGASLLFSSLAPLMILAKSNCEVPSTHALNAPAKVMRWRYWSSKLVGFPSQLVLPANAGQMHNPRTGSK